MARVSGAVLWFRAAWPNGPGLYRDLAIHHIMVLWPESMRLSCKSGQQGLVAQVHVMTKFTLQALDDTVALAHPSPPGPSPGLKGTSASIISLSLPILQSHSLGHFLQLPSMAGSLTALAVFPQLALAVGWGSAGVSAQLASVSWSSNSLPAGPCNIHLLSSMASPD